MGLIKSRYNPDILYRYTMDCASNRLQSEMGCEWRRTSDRNIGRGEKKVAGFILGSGDNGAEVIERIRI
jgi:hypothetical protein